MTLHTDKAWVGRTVLITGHTGFKGAWLCLWLARTGARLVGLALDPPTQPNLFDAAHVRELLDQDLRGDVRELDVLCEVMARLRPDVVIHMAAQPLVLRGYREPHTTFATNVMGTVNVLEAVRRLQRPCVVLVVTTDKCYAPGNPERPRPEEDPLGGTDPYSASKASAEMVVEAYRRAFFPPAQAAQHRVWLASARAGNVIGGGDWADDRIMADAARALAAGRSIPVRRPQAVRPWQHVLECISGYTALIERLIVHPTPSLCSGWNFGPRPGDEARVADLAEAFCRAWGDGRWHDAGDPNAPFEAPALRLSVQKAKSELGWQPRWTWRDAVQRTAKWYREFYARGANVARQLCEADIEAYLQTGSSA